MRYLLDTNVIIELLRGNKSVQQRLSEVGIGACSISDLTLYELYCGAAYSARPVFEMARIDMIANQIEVVDTRDVAKEAARQKSLLRKKGQLIEDFDIIIGSAAVCNNRIMVTANTNHLSRLDSIVCENWES